MGDAKNVAVLSLCVFYLCYAMPIQAAMLDWFWNNENQGWQSDKKDISSDVSVPFESKTDDEKFLEEALKFTDIMKSSALDVCQHNVVLKIKTSCGSMTEEELAKMSVNLLNCQSQVDGRAIFPCTETMTLKECTVNMDPAMWNAYHMMNNRARAVCLSARRSQFQALSEMTVNKLLSSSQQQIHQMAELQKGQEELEALTADTMAAIREGNVDILVEQDKIRTAQQNVQNTVMLNLKELSREKSLIAAGNRELDIIKQKIDETNKEIVLQSLERSGHHQKVISDIETIQKQAEAIFAKIEQSTQRLLSHHAMASKRYEETLLNLKKINDTIGYLTQLFTSTHTELETRVEWIKSFLGDSGEELNRLTTAVLHIAYLIMGMVLASFLHFPFVSRVALILILPLNLMLVYEGRTDLTMDLFQITASLILITLVNIFINFVISYTVPQRPQFYLVSGDGQKTVHTPTIKTDQFMATRWNFSSGLRAALAGLMCRLKGWWGCLQYSSNPLTETPREQRSAVYDSFVSSTGRYEEDNNETVTPRHQTPPRQASNNHVNSWLNGNHFSNNRAGTPLSTTSIGSGSLRKYCASRTGQNRPCRNKSTPGSDYCWVHETGTSIAE